MMSSKNGRLARLPRWTWAIGATAPLILAGCGAPDHGLAPVSVLANAVACIDQQTSNDGNTYSEPRVFLEAQSWWGEQVNGTFPVLGAAEHLHVAMCFPLQQNVSGSLPFRVRIR